MPPPLEPMPTLWLRFAQDSGLPSRLDETHQAKLAEIFAADPRSLWQRALRRAGLTPPPCPEGMLRRLQGVPYVNWTFMVRAVSGGSLLPVPKDDGFAYQESYCLKALLGMMKAQWRLSAYVQAQCEAAAHLPETQEEKLVESLALGCAILGLTMRIPTKNAVPLQDGLMDERKVAAPFRGVVAQIKQLQRRRNLLSPVWAQLFDQAKPQDWQPDRLPPFFWNEKPETGTTSLQAAPVAVADFLTVWTGIAVAGQRAVTGRALLVRGEEDIAAVKAMTEPAVLVFALARPETVALFPHAVAVLYGEGGALCHACSVARERNLPCMTGLGSAFIRAMDHALSSDTPVILRVDPARRLVERQRLEPEAAGR